MVGARDEGGPAPAQGMPAPLTEEHIHALARGVADEAEIARILESHAQQQVPSTPARRGRKRSPVRIATDELATLRDQGRTPKAVADRLREAERKDTFRAADRPEHEQPTARPPRAPRRRR